MEQNKPPMTVWLASDAATCFGYNGDCGASDTRNHHYKLGPYVHINQFLEVVTRYANETAEHGLSFDREFVDIAYQYAEELNDDGA